jgi:3-phenylpropionate/trans-cinnamate dioxygenase ferredoxin reductase subunit
MADRDVDFLLIGGGPGGAKCARALREKGTDGSILLVGREPDPPYARPPCSKSYLRGEVEREEILLQAPEWWEEAGVELRIRTTVTKLDAERRVATLSTREEVSFSKALLATGANVRRLPVEGSELDGIHYLRTLGTADSIREDVADAQDVVLVGGSYIGTEVAASLATMGKRCTVVMQEEVAFEGPFGRQAGAFFQGVLEDHGVRFVPGEQLDRFEGDGERVRRVVTKGGAQLDAEVVVLGVGVAPDVTLARGAGLALGDRGGVRCDARLQTSAPGVFAAGDICEYDSVLHDRPVRIEHWDVASQQGVRAAAAMLGDERPYDVVPYFFSDLADWSSMKYVGPALDGWDEEVVRGSLADGEFTIWYLRDGRLAAGLTVGRPDDLEAARELIVARSDLSGREGELADASVDAAALGAARP